MQRTARWLVALVIGFGAVGMAGQAQSGPVPSPGSRFDPARDAAKDIQLALAEARRTHRRVILDVGGEWCGWCHTLDRYFVEHPDLQEARDRLYVWVKVNFSLSEGNRRGGPQEKLARVG